MSHKKIYILDEETVEMTEKTLNIKLAADRRAYITWKWLNWNWLSDESKFWLKRSWVDSIRDDMYELQRFNRIFNSERD